MTAVARAFMLVWLIAFGWTFLFLPPRAFTAFCWTWANPLRRPPARGHSDAASHRANSALAVSSNPQAAAVSGDYPPPGFRAIRQSASKG